MNPSAFIHRRLPALAGATAALALLLALPARADLTNLLYQFNTTFSANSVAPSGPAPWVTANFANTNGGVLLTISNLNLLGAEKLDLLDLNINPNLNVANLTFTLQSQVGSFTAPTISTGEDGFKADGDGYYDLQLQFTTSTLGSFNGGEAVTYLLAGINGLAAGDFAYLSSPGGGVGPFYGAAHIQGTGTGSSSAWLEPAAGATFYVVPEPGIGALLSLAACLGLAIRYQRKS